MASSSSPQFVIGSNGAAVRWRSVAGKWLPHDKARVYLIALVDEATGQCEAQFSASDSCHENLLLLRQYVEKNGCPHTVVTNGKTLFRGNPRTPLASGNSRIQRVLAELSIEQVTEATTARSASVARFLRFARKTLAREMRSEHIKSLHEANRFLQTQFLPHWNSLCPVALGTNHHRAAQVDLELAFSEVAIRKLQAGLICYRGTYYSVKPALGETVRIEERLDGSTRVLVGNSPATLIPEAAPLTLAAHTRKPERIRKVSTAPKKPPTTKRWMDDFFQRPPRPLWSILKPSRFGD